MRILPVRGSGERTGHAFDPARLAATRVSANREIAPGVYRLSFPRTWDFVPGQSVAVTLDPAVPPRFYSIASGTQDPLVDIIFDVIPEGLLTPRLATCAPGDPLLVSAPFGAFRDAEGPSFWIATSTGIAPFVSMARSGVFLGKTLVHGARFLSGLLDRSYFASLLGPCYLPCCSRERGPGVFAGRPTEWATEHPLPPEARYLLCGNSLMVVDVRDIIIGKGVPFENVVAEIYF